MMDELFKLSHTFIQNNNKVFKRYFLKKYSLDNRFSIIIGAKGVGKTTAVIQFLLNYIHDDIFSKEALYVQSDHFLVGNHSLYEITEEFVKQGGKLICFDEIHKYPAWSKELKSINDTFPLLKIIASGSSTLEIYRGSHDLSRRAIVYNMHEMSFREFLEFNLTIDFNEYSLEEILNQHQLIAKAIIEKIEDKKLKILPLFKEYLKYGCYPYFCEFEDKNLFYITLEQNIHATVENDLLAICPGLNGAGLKKIKRLISVIAESVPFTPDMRNLKNCLDIGDERTLKNYLKHLEDGRIILTLSKKGSSLKGLEKPEKIYLNNTNLMHAVGSEKKLEKGNLRENFFINTISAFHDIKASKRGDFFVEDAFTFEVGGKGKGYSQISNMPDSYLALDEIEIGVGNKIPLWLFGFLY